MIYPHEHQISCICSSYFCKCLFQTSSVGTGCLHNVWCKEAVLWHRAGMGSLRLMLPSGTYLTCKAGTCSSAVCIYRYVTLSVPTTAFLITNYGCGSSEICRWRRCKAAGAAKLLFIRRLAKFQVLAHASNVCFCFATLIELLYCEGCLAFVLKKSQGQEALCVWSVFAIVLIYADCCAEGTRLYGANMAFMDHGNY